MVVHEVITMLALRCRASLCLLAILGSGSAMGAESIARPPTRDELAAILQAREEFLSSFAVNARVKRVDPFGKSEQGEYQLIFRDGNTRCVATWGGTRYDVASVDGTVTNMSGSLEKWQVAEIQRNEAPTIPWGVSIHGFLTEVYNRKLSDFCGKIATSVTVEGNQIVVEAIRSEDDPTDEFRVRVMLQADQSYAFVGVERSIRTKGSGQWAPHSSTRMTGLKQYRSSGYFLPSHVTYSAYTRFGLPGNSTDPNPFSNDQPSGTKPPAASEGLSPRLLVGFEGELSNWTVPAEVSSDTFRISIPDGVNVHDSILGLNYVKTTLSDKESGGQASAARSFSSRPRSWVIGLLIVLSFIAIGGGVWYLRTRKGTKS